MDTRFFCVFSMALVPFMSAVGQTKRASFDGVWQAIEVTLGGPAGAMTVKPGPNLTIFSGKHYSRIDVQTDKPRPVVDNPSNASADELRQTWGPLVAEAGTYEVADNQMTLRPIVAKNPAVMAPNVTLVYSYKLEGDTLTLTAQRDRNGPVAHPFTVKLARIE
jgi:hypothetical protein